MIQCLICGKEFKDNEIPPYGNCVPEFGPAFYCSKECCERSFEYGSDPFLDNESVIPNE